MARKKNEAMELRFYEIPQGEPVLALLGEAWNRIYGHEEIRLHFHNLLEIGICRRGSGRLVLDDKEQRYESGMFSVIPENVPHTTISDGMEANFWEYLFIDVRAAVAELYPDNPVYQNEIVDNINKRPMLMQSSQASTLGWLIDAIMSEMRERKQYYGQMVRFYLKALIIEIMRQHTKLPNYAQKKSKDSNMSRIASVLEYINDHYSAPLKVKELAETSRMSETHFRRVFFDYVNMTPMDYVNLVRIQKACELMKKNDDSMDRIAEKCGFTTTSTFNRNFKKFLNTSPYQWKISPENYEHRLLNYRISALKGW